MSEQDHPFQPGVEVVLVSSGWSGTRITNGRVAKVHKTGKFTIEGRAQQYRARRTYDSDGWRGDAAGDSYSLPTVHLASPKWDAEVAKINLQNRFSALLKAINEGACRTSASPASVSAAENLLAAIKAENKGPTNADAA